MTGDNTRDAKQVETPAQKRGLASDVIAPGTIAGRAASVRAGHSATEATDDRSTTNAAKVVGDQPEGSGSPGAAADREQASE